MMYLTPLSFINRPSANSGKLKGLACICLLIMSSPFFLCRQKNAMMYQSSKAAN